MTDGVKTGAAIKVSGAADGRILPVPDSVISHRSGPECLQQPCEAVVHEGFITVTACTHEGGGITGFAVKRDAVKASLRPRSSDSLYLKV